MALTVIEDKNDSAGTYFKKVVKNRGLIFSFAKRDIKAKYAQSILGIAWSLIQPAFALLIFWVFFDLLIDINTGDIAYPLFAFSGMVMWYTFSSMVHQGGNTLIENQDLIKKIYFPKLILPLSRSLGSMFDLGISLIALLVVMIVFQQPIGLKALLIPVAIILLLTTAFTASIWLNVLTVKRRDLQHVIPYLINYGIWLTPVFYPTTIVPEAYREYIYYFNPVATAIELFRACLFDQAFNMTYLISFAPIFVFLVIGLILFKNRERNMADFL